MEIASVVAYCSPLPNAKCKLRAVAVLSHRQHERTVYSQAPKATWLEGSSIIKLTAEILEKETGKDSEKFSKMISCLIHGIVV